MKKMIMGLVMCLMTGGSLWAEVSLPAIISDHMVLQAGVETPVWGWADPGEEITVMIGSQSKTTKAGADGKWKIQLDKLASGTVGTLTVKGRNTLVVNDVLAGEVWLCSGQSNMAARGGGSKDAGDLSTIRMFEVTSGFAVEPQEKCKGEWVVCTSRTAGGFSAVAYFFGREIHQITGQPVGLINASVPATMIEVWTSLEAQKDVPELRPLFAEWARRQAIYNPEKAKADYLKAKEAYAAKVEQARAAGKPVPLPPQLAASPREGGYPGNLFNGKIAPLIPYAIRGVIWYQGESNALFGTARGLRYTRQLELLVKDWRSRWGLGEFPFAWVQLPNYGDSSRSSGWAEVREGMLKSLSLPNTGMAITIDLGEAKNLHPRNKKDVGHRLALWASAKVYGRNIPYSGPLPSGQQVKGTEVICSFEHADGGLLARDGELKGFEIAGADKKWVKVNARIVGAQVVVSSPQVNVPVAVRYGWADNPDCNLVNGAGLPASPFRTHMWE